MSNSPHTFENGDPSDAHDEGMNVIMRRDEYGSMVVCAERFAITGEGWTQDELTVVEVTYLPTLPPFALVLPGSIVSMFGPRLGF